MFSGKPEAGIRGRFAADDWGLSPAVNEAILELARAGALHSVSLLANLPYLEQGLPELRATGVAFSAHLNFTLGKPLSRGAATLTGRSGRFRRFPAFVARAALGRISPAELEREADAQLSRLRALVHLESANGHQHVHLLPWLAAPLAGALRRHGILRVRRMVDWDHRASATASLLGARWLAKELPGIEWEATGYLWPTGELNSARLREKLSRVPSLPLLVHPSARDDFGQVAHADSLRAGRVREFQQLRELL